MAFMRRLLSTIPKSISTTTTHHFRRHITTTTIEELTKDWVYNSNLVKGYPVAALYLPARDSYTVRADMPGIQTSDLTYNISGSRIHLSGQEPKTHRFGSGRVEPRFYEVDIEYDPIVYAVDRVKVDVRSGVLWVRVPKIEFDGPDGPVIIRMGSLKIKMVGAMVAEMRDLKTNVLIGHTQIVKKK